MKYQQSDRWSANTFKSSCRTYDSVTLYIFQKEATGALTHAGAHLDLSAFSSWEVSQDS